MTHHSSKHKRASRSESERKRKRKDEDLLSLLAGIWNLLLDRFCFQFHVLLIQHQHQLMMKLTPLWVICTLFAVLAVAEDISCNNDSTDGSCSNNQYNLDPKVQQWIEELPTENSLYINGAWSNPNTINGINNISVVNPSTGQTIAKVSVASKDDVNEAVRAAREALDGWSIDTKLNERRKLVHKLLQLYNENSEQM